MADTRHKRTIPVNRKIFWPFFIIIIYTALAVPLACDIWQGSLGTNIDIHGRITLSILVLCVICPLFSSGSVFAIFYIKNGMGRRSLPELFFPPDSMPVTRMVGSESRKSMRLQTLCLVMQITAMSTLTVFPFLLLLTVLQRWNG